MSEFLFLLLFLVAYAIGFLIGDSIKAWRKK